MRGYAIFCFCLVGGFISSAHAVNNISITADTIVDGETTFSQPAILINLPAKTIDLRAQHVKANALEARNAQLNLNYQNKTKAYLNAEFKQPNTQSWLKANLSCDVPAGIVDQLWHCPNGLLKADNLNIPFSIDLTPYKNGGLADISLTKSSFSDATGLHAAEKLSGRLKIQLTKNGQEYRWNSFLTWTEGEMFWQPFYIANGGHSFKASGLLTDHYIQFDQAELAINEVGLLDFKGELNRKSLEIKHLEANLKGLNLANAYPLVFKPMLDKTAFNNADIAGVANFKITIKDTEIKELHLSLSDVDIDDKNKKFAFYKVNAEIPWSYDDAKQVSLNYANGHLLNIPLGKTNLQAQVNRYAWTASSLSLPMLDGALNLKEVSAARIGGNWYWHLGAVIAPISMTQLSNALNLPTMQGDVSAKIPQVTYSGGILTANGEMQFNVFDGVATVTNLTMHQPLGMNPLVQADLRVRNLDLGDLTRTFSFGAIEGKLDGDIANLEMQNWKTTMLDAKFYSSPGKYQKKISQRAVENISALGGASAAAAVQRSFLRFFNEFNYSTLGISCQLANDVCKMDGVESTNGGYVIVKGSGIPAITVMGYNHTVGWNDLLNRIKRITDSNTKAVVK